jgi:hypothetical protein
MKEKATRAHRALEAVAFNANGIAQYPVTGLHTDVALLSDTSKSSREVLIPNHWFYWNYHFLGMKCVRNYSSS